MMALQIILFMPKNKHTVSIYEPNIRHLTKHILSKLQAKTDLLIKKDVSSNLLKTGRLTSTKLTFWLETYYYFYNYLRHTCLFIYKHNAYKHT